MQNVHRAIQIELEELQACLYTLWQAGRCRLVREDSAEPGTFGMLLADIHLSMRGDGQTQVVTNDDAVEQVIQTYGRLWLLASQTFVESLSEALTSKQRSGDN